ncbi:thymidine phosphorylase-like isoform X1 [Pollicipes pollicipes]|uniref:thymidine phosphorylase-like isoform X1 n=1 Tax=Pollicipes pollicipes TaxID=41117 RepID=UPI001884CEC4|nr:thymidine phosphorylase-like isoform X1 [Pollicipes pollicipes]
MHGLHVVDLIKKKALGQELSPKEIQFFVTQVSERKIDQVQLGAMLMAIYTHGMRTAEVTQLTAAMTRSGQVLAWPADWLVVDKHSTGGVGDKVSLPLAAALAARGFKVPMVSGRGLGHTGGTLDKLEAIPGFTVSMTAEQMRQSLERVGCCIVGQTQDLVPADRILYASRDITATVDSAPLITSSIISKKAAEGLRALVLDVKYGSGAFMKEFDEARDTAQLLVNTSKGMGISTAALVTNMDSPIGRAVGNALEVAESIACLRGEGAPDLVELVTELGGRLAALAGQTSPEEGCRQMATALHDGSALDKFQQMLESQGVSQQNAQQLCRGDPWGVLTKADHVESVPATATGYVSDIDAMTVAQVCLSLGAGRKKAADTVDHRVGVTLAVRPGEHVQAGQAWAQIHHCGTLTEPIRQQLSGALTVVPDPVKPGPRVTGLVQ